MRFLLIFRAFCGIAQEKFDREVDAKMGIRFRKSIKIAPGVKVNIGKKSVGMSIGTKGARVSINSKGRITNSVGIPGTGVSYTSSTQIGKKKSRSTENSLNLPQYNDVPKTGSMDGFLACMFLFAASVILGLFGLLALLFSVGFGLKCILVAIAIFVAAALWRNKLIAAQNHEEVETPKYDGNN